MSKENIPVFRRICRKFVYLTAPIWSDKTFLRMYFWCNLGYKLNLKSPRTFNEKLNWLKIYNKHPEYSKLVDKKEAKEYVASIVGEKYIIPTIAVYDNVEDIDFESLPKQFVLKCTHDSGGIVVCKDKTTLDKEAAIRKLKKGLNSNFVSITREYPYKNVIPRIIAEQYMEDETGELRDYKFFCFNGKVQFFKIDFCRFTNHRANYYDKQGNLLRFGEIECPPDYNHIEILPENINEMIAIAETLSKCSLFLRVDLFNVKGKIFFGELTFFPASGLGSFFPENNDEILGSYIHLQIDKQ